MYTHSLAKAKGGLRKRIIKSWQLYCILALPVIYLLVFCYYPMLGAQIAFKDYSITLGIWGSPWVGLKHFKEFIDSYEFVRVISNTIILSFYGLAASFFPPIILALCISYIKNAFAKKTVQMITYAPYFISTVVLVGMMCQFFSIRTGVFNNFISLLGFSRVDIMSAPESFRHLDIWSDVWQSTGFSSIIYLAALTGIDPGLYEAATLDGANKFKQIWYIDIPGILPTAIILLILSCGSILGVGFEKVYLLQTPLNLSQSEVISTYVYKVGLKAQIPMYSYSSAVDLFTSLISLILLTTVNRISKLMSGTSIW